MPNENITARIGEALANTPFENYQFKKLTSTDQVRRFERKALVLQ